VPLWIEALPPEEALAEVRNRRGPIFRVQEARFLIDAGQGEAAREVLDRLPGLPRGLQRLRDGLGEGFETQTVPLGAEPEPEAPHPIASKTLAELHASQGDVKAAIAMYREILDRDPADEGARDQLRELMGGKQERVEVVLSQWLQRVRLWRRALGV
jgi:hypothetical protein